MSYKCQKCGKQCKILYSDKERKIWICEKCWEQEEIEDK